MTLTRFFESDPDTGVVELDAVVDVGTGGGVTDHGALTGLSDDDHTQYILVAGTRAFLANQSVGGFIFTNHGTPTVGTHVANKQYVDDVGTTVLTAATAYTDSELDGDKGDITITAGVWAIDNDAVTYAKIQDVSATDKILGRASSGSGIIEEITCTSTGRSILDDTSVSAVRTTISAAPLNAEFLTVSSAGTANGELTEKRVITMGSGLVATDGGDNSTYTIAQRIASCVPLATGRNVLTNVPAGTTEWGANNPFRVKIDLTNANQIRISCRLSTVGASGSATLFLQYSTDESSWSTLTSNTIALCTGSAGTRVTAYENVPAGAKSDVFVRFVTTGGDGAADPEAGNIIAQFI